MFLKNRFGGTTTINRRSYKIADGAKHNWEIQINNFPDAIPILDFYHACEHLANFCSFLPKKKSEKQYKKWKKMIYEGEIVQVMEEMK